MELARVGTAVGDRTPALAAVAGSRTTVRLDGVRRPADVVHRGRDAVYVDESGWALGVVAGPASWVPCALAVRPVGPGADLDLSTVDSAEVGAGVVRLHREEGSLVVRVVRQVSTTVPRLATVPSRELLTLLRHHASPALDELGAEVVSGVAGDPGRLLGLGSGLTPLGDDVLAGWAAASFALGTPVVGADPRGSTTLLSATLIDCARRGEVLPELRALVQVLARADSDRAAVQRSAAALAAVGHTSGTGLLLGLCLRLERGGR